jgi:hypothetical protein
MIDSSFLEALVSKNGLKYYIYNDDRYPGFPLSVRLEIEFEGYKYESWGVSSDHDLAFFKAYMELVERVCLSKSCPIFYKKSWFNSEISIQDISRKYNLKLALLYPDNSNGMAISTNPSLAKKSAIKELIERHVILSALYLDISPFRLLVKPNILPKIPAHELDFFYWKYPGFFVVVCCVRLSSGGLLFTHACEKSIDEGVIKSFEEVSPNIIFFDKNPDQKIEISNVEFNNISSFNHYWKFSGDRSILKFLNGSNDNKFGIPVLKNIYLGEVEVPSVFQQAGFKSYCYRAICPEAQQLFFDNWNDDYINPLIVNEGSQPRFPHFIS